MEQNSKSENPKQSSGRILLDNIGLALNIINTQIGVGIITLPLSLLMGGLFFSLICAVLCIYLIFYSSILMVRASLLAPEVRTYGELCNAAHGQWLRLYSSTITFLLTFGFASVYSITLRKQLEDVVADVTGVTFKYGQLALLGVMVFVGLISMTNKVLKLAYVSFFSALCVMLMIVVAVVRGPFYHNELVGMTVGKIISNEESLEMDRAMWACGEKKTDFGLKEWHSVQVTNFNLLDESLEAHKACELKRLSWNAVSDAIASIAEAPTMKNPQPGIVSWADVLQFEHCRHLFNEYSLNTEGEVRRGFQLFSFLNWRFFITLGTFASAFIYQHASIANFQEMKNRTVSDYKVVTAISFTFVLACCLVIALAGYFSQQYQIGPFIFTKMKLRYYQPGKLDSAVIAARVALIISICLTYPMQFFYSRLNLMIVVVVIRNRLTGGDWDPQRPGRVILYTCTAIMWVLSLVIGIFLEKAAMLFALVGALLGGQMIYILPIVCWMALKGGFKKVAADTKRKGNWEFLKGFVFPVSVMGFGVFNVISSTVVTALDMMELL